MGLELMMAKKTKKLDDWFNDHVIIDFVGGDTKENKKLKKKMTKDLKDGLKK